MTPLRLKLNRLLRPIPTVGVTGSIGKTTTAQMIASVLRQTYKTVALSTSQGAWLGNEIVKTGDCSRGDVARALYLDPAAEAGVFELARGSLLDRGMVLRSVDVGVFLNVHENHVGQRGIRTKEDMAQLKSVVVKRAKKTAVLNADDPLCLQYRHRIKAPRLCLVSVDPENSELRKHKKRGGLVGCMDPAANCLQLHEGDQLLGRLEIGEIPATWNGCYKPAAVNALFAMAAAYGCGLPFAAVAQGLRTFRSSVESNMGRMNYIDDLPYPFWITTADGREAYTDLAAFFRLQGKASRRKILLLTCMGNRTDEWIVETGRLVADAFTDFIVSDWEELRERKPGEAAALLRHGLLKGGANDAYISVADSYEEGLRLAFTKTSPDDMLVISSYSGDNVWLESRKYVSKATLSGAMESDELQAGLTTTTKVDKYGIDSGNGKISPLNAMRCRLALRTRLKLLHAHLHSRKESNRAVSTCTEHKNPAPHASAPRPAARARKP